MEAQQAPALQLLAHLSAWAEGQLLRLVTSQGISWKGRLCARAPHAAAARRRRPTRSRTLAPSHPTSCLVGVLSVVLVVCDHGLQDAAGLCSAPTQHGPLAPAHGAAQSVGWCKQVQCDGPQAAAGASCHGRLMPTQSALRRWTCLVPSATLKP